MPLEHETNTYKCLKSMLLADEGRFVIISGNRLLGIDDECEGAIKAGCAKCG